MAMRATLSAPARRFAEHIDQDVERGTLRPEDQDLARAVLSPMTRDAPPVRLSTFAVDGVQANDMVVIRPARPPTQGSKTLLYMPEDGGPSFHAFADTQGMQAWLKETAADPTRLARFATHFSDRMFPARRAHVEEKMRAFQRGDGNAVVGPFGDETDDIFRRLGRGSTAAPVPVKGLEDLQFEQESAAGGDATFSGRRPDGVRVRYRYDPYGNFIGTAGNGRDFYFQRNGLNGYQPLKPLSLAAFQGAIRRTVEANVAAADPQGLYGAFIRTLQNPASGLGEALQVFGVPEGAATATERYLENPLSATLTDLNKDNAIGAVFGLDHEAMNAALKGVGAVGQGFVPFYGQARLLATLTAKALKKEPMTDEDRRQFAEALGGVRFEAGTRRGPAANGVGAKPAQQPSSTEPPAAPKDKGSSVPAAASSPTDPANATGVARWAAFRSAYTTAGRTPGADGVYRIDGAPFVALGPPTEGAAQSLYAIHRNPSTGKFEMRKPGELASWQAPVVRQNENGSFEVVDSGLRGGGGRPPSSSTASSSSSSSSSTAQGAASKRPGPPDDTSTSTPAKQARREDEGPQPGRSTRPAAPDAVEAGRYDIPYPEAILQSGLFHDPTGFNALPRARQLQIARDARRIETAGQPARDRLVHDSDAALQAFTPPSPDARPHVRLPEDATDVQGFIHDAYASTRGLVVGEVHHEPASRQFLIRHMPTFQQNRVGTLYMEHFVRELDGADLAAFNRSGEMNPRLASRIAHMDTADRTPPGSAYGVRQLLQAAHAHGLAVQPLDNMAARTIATANKARQRTPMRVPGAVAIRQAAAANFSRERGRTANYAWWQEIRQHQAANGDRPWLALMGAAHANGAADRPGVAILTHTVSVRAMSGAVTGHENISRGSPIGAANTTDFTVREPRP